MKKYIVALTALAITACAPEPTQEELEVQQARERIVQAEQQEQRRIDAVRQQNPEVNWLYTGISTGKHSENIVTEVYQTHSECLDNQSMEANACSAMAALPQSYWNAQ